MFKNLFLYKGLSSIKSYEIDKRIAIFLLAGMIFVFIFILFGLAVVELDNDDFSFIEINRTNRIEGILSSIMLLLGFQLGVFALILFEFLRGHIAKKRFAEKTLGIFALILLFEFWQGHISEKRFSERTIYVGFPLLFDLVFLTTARNEPSFVFNASERH